MLTHAALFPCSLFFLLSWYLLSHFLPGRCRPEAQQVVVYYAFTFSSTTFFISLLQFFLAFTHTLSLSTLILLNWWIFNIGLQCARKPCLAGMPTFFYSSLSAENRQFSLGCHLLQTCEFFRIEVRRFRADMRQVSKSIVSGWERRILLLNCVFCFFALFTTSGRKRYNLAVFT